MGNADNEYLTDNEHKFLDKILLVPENQIIELNSLTFPLQTSFTFDGSLPRVTITRGINTNRLTIVFIQTPKIYIFFHQYGHNCMYINVLQALFVDSTISDLMYLHKHIGSYSSLASFVICLWGLCMVSFRFTLYTYILVNTKNKDWIWLIWNSLSE